MTRYTLWTKPRAKWNRVLRKIKLTNKLKKQIQKNVKELDNDG